MTTDYTTIAAITAAYLALQNQDDDSQTPRQIKYHSVILWFLFGWLVLWLPVPYYTFSRYHKWYIIHPYIKALLCAALLFLIQKWKRHRDPEKISSDKHHIVEDDATPINLAKMKAYQQLGAEFTDIKYVAPDGTITHFNSPDALIAYVKKLKKSSKSSKKA